MPTVFRPRYAIVALAAAIVFAPAVQAATNADAPMSYADMCVQSVDMPKPYGESDLKGNPKLKTYCDCFGPKFMARAQRAAQNWDKPPPPLAQQNKEELEMRNSCRKQVGLPLVKAP